MPSRPPSRWLVRGGARLEGEVRVAGARNAALPLLAASLLAPGTSIFHHVPRLGDVDTLLGLLAELGVRVGGEAEGQVETQGEAQGETQGARRPLRLGTEEARGHEVRHGRVRALRAAVLLIGPLVGRHGVARVALPGGSALGPRPIGEHLQGLAAMGAEIQLDHGDLVVRAPRGRLQGAAIKLSLPTVTGTENLMMAAVLGRGRTTIENAAREPEVEELARLLNKMGARIEGVGTSFVTVHGVERLHPVEHVLMPDRIEAGTFLVAAAVTRGELLVWGAVPEHLQAVVAKLRSTGATVTQVEGGLHVRGASTYTPLDITTQPYPGFPTDLQAQLMVLACLASGESLITETMFENRWMHAAELERLGADILVSGRAALVRGPRRLMGAPVVASDSRASAALVLAGLCAEGETEVLGAERLDEGYEQLAEKLGALGADIRRIHEEA